LTCPYCNNDIRRHLLSEHFDNCDKKEISCIHGCGLKLPKNQQDLHNLQCSEVVINCVGYPLSCDFKTKRKEMNDHERSCVLVKLTPLFKNMKDQISVLEQSNSLLKDRILVLEDRNSQLQQSNSLLQNRISVLENQNQNLSWNFVNTPDKKKLTRTGYSMGIIHCEPSIPSNGISVITFLVQSIDAFKWSSFGIVAKESLGCNEYHSTHYVGWFANIYCNGSGVKFGLNAGCSYFERNIFKDKIFSEDQKKTSRY